MLIFKALSILDKLQDELHLGRESPGCQKRQAARRASQFESKLIILPLTLYVSDQFCRIDSN